jgi:AcrR family transcriptional regulator
VTETATGLRERKKQQTRVALAEAGLRLFAERGYDETTLAEIAEAAGVSTRTIFAYFASKEDILFASLQAMLDAVAGALTGRAEGTDALTALRDFIVTSAPEKDELDHRVADLIAGDPTLASHQRARMSQLRDLLAVELARDLGVAPDDLRPNVAAASLVSAFEVLERQHPGHSKPAAPEDVAAAIDPIIAFVRAGLAALPGS